MHDGSHIRLRKVEIDYDPMDLDWAVRTLHKSAEKEEFLTGLIYVNPTAKSFLDTLNLDDEPLASLPQDKVTPGPEVLNRVMRDLM